MLDPQQRQYLIGTVSKQSGIKPDLIRAWERRYQVVEPTRTEGKQRLYNENDILKLSLLHKATQQGHSISRIAQMTVAQLQQLLKIEQPKKQILKSVIADDNLSHLYLNNSFQAIENFDSRRLENILEEALEELGALNFIESLLIPLLTQIGEHWEKGQLRIAQEHMATAIIRSLMYILRHNTPYNSNAPSLIIATPQGQMHELGALLAAIIAEMEGWQVMYLGCNLPVEELAIAVKHQEPDVLGLSISFENENFNMLRELRKLKKLLPEKTQCIIGGRIAQRYQILSKELQFHLVPNEIKEYKALLARLRNH